MSAVLGAFVQYLITFILLVAAAAGGIFLWKEVKNEEEHGKQHGWYWKYIR